MNLLPLARTTNLVVQDLDNELLIYDMVTHQAYQLNETSMIVFNACDGRRTFEDLKHQFKFTDDLIYLALDKLQKQNLLEGNYISPFTGMDRRQVIRRVGLATAIALPIISGLIAPQAIQAASGRPDNCGPLNVCRPRNSAFCPLGCTATINVIFYFGGTSGSCEGPGNSSVQDCSRGQGDIAGVGYIRTA